jgi:PKD repeat protein
LIVEFTFSAANATDYTIFFDDGGSEPGSIAAGLSVVISHQYADPGTYNPVLTVTGPGGSDTAYPPAPISVE